MKMMKKKKGRISQSFQRWLIVLVTIAFLTTTALLWVIQDQLSQKRDDQAQNAVIGRLEQGTGHDTDRRGQEAQADGSQRTNADGDHFFGRIEDGQQGQRHGLEDDETDAHDDCCRSDPQL